jgi:hypothetical protein
MDLDNTAYTTAPLPCLLKPVRHTHLPIHRCRNREVFAGLLALIGVSVDSTEAKVAVSRFRPQVEEVVEEAVTRVDKILSRLKSTDLKVPVHIGAGGVSIAVEIAAQLPVIQ